VEQLLRYGLLAVFIALVLTPFGLPVPEDISLLVGGVLAASEQFTLAEALVVGWLGVIIGDSISWTFGRRIGVEPKGFLSRLIGHRQIKRIERFYLRYGTWAIVIARQIPGMRLPAFFFAGATGIRYPRFLIVDGLAALITVNLYVLLGWFFANRIDEILPWLDGVRVVGGVVAVGVGAALVIRWWQRRVHDREDAEDLAEEAVQQPPAEG